MVRLEVNVETIANEAAELIRAFFPKETVDLAPEPQHGEYSISVKAFFDGNCWKTELKTASGRTVHKEKNVVTDGEEDIILKKRQIKAALKETVYYALKELTSRGLPYGMLTGVRPLTLSNRFLESNSPEKTERLLQSEFDVSPEKARLLTQTSLYQETVRPNENDVSLYIHVPFCSTRCNYCSFPSELTERVEPMMDEYLDALEKEVKFITSTAKGSFEALYVGGGTPTSLSERHFERLCGICKDAVDKCGINEFTLEAGRPDTINRKKLIMMKNASVTRISINPQTMNDKTLEAIGRRHTAKDIVDTFLLARELGFDNINMDLIMGLTGEDEKDIENTFEKVLQLDPDGITIHVLALKHASVLNRDGIDIFEGLHNIDGVMREYTEEFARRGYKPYYLYRQKYMLDGLENVGYCKDEKICRYNIRMMDDKSTCYAAGAGSVSKRCYSGTTRIERRVNPKMAIDYIGSIDECIEKKREIMDQ